MPDKDGDDDKKSTKSVVNKKQKQMMGEQQQKKIIPSGQGLTNYNLPDLPGLGGGGGGTDSIMATSRSKSLGKRIGDVAKLATVPARFMLNIKSPVDPTTNFAAPTTVSGKVDSAITNYKMKQKNLAQADPRQVKRKGRLDDGS